MRVYTVSLDGMEFFSYHGCNPDEKINGNTFMVDLKAVFSAMGGETDRLEDTLNYGAMYNIVAAQMAIPSNLLEHVSARIMDALTEAFPSLLEASVTVSKKNPPVAGPCQWSRVTLNWKKDE